MPHTWPSLTRKPASRSSVPLRLYSNSRRTGRPGAAVWSGEVGVRTPMPGFSSTQNSGPSVGGLSSSSMTATALVANSGSRSFIQVSKTVQSELVPFEDDTDGALAGMTQAQFGMDGHVLRQVFDAPVRLASTAWIDLCRFPAVQHQQSSLDVGVVPPRRRALRTVLESIESVLSKAMAPQPDRPLRNNEILSDTGVGLAIGDPQNDLRAVGVLLRTGACCHATLQL